MYGYYMLRSLKIKVPPQVAQIITTAQMVQVGFFVFQLSGIGNKYYQVNKYYYHEPIS